MNQLIEFYGNNDYRDYLAHHGILEQEWGVRHGPPYPLDYGDHSAAEKRAMSKKGVKYMGAEGSELIRKKPKRKSLKERFEEAKSAKLAAKKKKLADEAIREGTAANLNRNRNLFSPDEIKEIVNKMDKQAEANRLLQARSSDFKRKAETRQKDLEKGNPSKILKNMDQYTVDEINDAVAKFGARQKLLEARRNERLKAIEAYVQKGASISKSIGDIANNLANIKTAYDKLNPKKPSEAIQSILNSGDPQKIIEAIKTGVVNTQQGKDALTQAQNIAALQKMIKYPGTDGSGNEVREYVEQQNQQGDKKTKGKNKNKNKQQEAQQQEHPQMETKSSGGSNGSENLKDLTDKNTEWASKNSSEKKESAGTEAKAEEPKKQGLFSKLGKKTEASKEEQKKSPAQSVMDLIPEPYRKDAAERSETYNKEKTEPTKASNDQSSSSSSASTVAAGKSIVDALLGRKFSSGLSSSSTEASSSPMTKKQQEKYDRAVEKAKKQEMETIWEDVDGADTSPAMAEYKPGREKKKK